MKFCMLVVRLMNLKYYLLKYLTQLYPSISTTANFIASSSNEYVEFKAVV